MTILICKEMFFVGWPSLILYGKSKEGVLPTYHGARYRLSIPGIPSLPMHSELLILLFRFPSLPCKLQCPSEIWLLLRVHLASSGVYGSCALVNFMPEFHVRTLGGTVGIAIGEALYTSILKRKIERIPGLSGYDTSPGALSESVRTLHNLPVSSEAKMYF
jgi:hypothetical protein